MNYDAVLDVIFGGHLRPPFRYSRKAERGHGKSYFTMLQRQQGFEGCPICDAPLDTSVDEDCRAISAIDHCHDTDEIRGVLCNTCNAGLGFFRDQPERLDRAAEYLRRHVACRDNRAYPDWHTMRPEMTDATDQVRSL